MADEMSTGLTPVQQDALAASFIKEELLFTTAVDKPRAVLTGGQPGSGKSMIVKAAEVDFEQLGGIVVIDPDELRPTIPYVQERIDAGDLNLPDVAYSDAGTVAYKSIQLAKDERRNILVDGTLANTERALKLARELADAGYEVEMRGMAVYPDLSHARTYTRQEAQIAASPTGFGRGVGDDFHNSAVTGFARTVDAYQVEKVVTALTLYNSEGTIEAECHLVDGQWTPDVSMAAVLKNAHENPSPEVKLAAVDAWQLAREAMTARNADPVELAKVVQFTDAATERASRSAVPATPQQSAAQFAAACKAEEVDVYRRAERLQTTLRSRLDAARTAVEEHRSSMPRAPSGPAAWLPGAERTHSRKFDSWAEERNRLTGTADRIEKRLDKVSAYTEAGATRSPGAAERLAAGNVTRRNPELASVAAEYAVTQREAKMASIVEDQTQQQRQKQARGR